MAEVPENPEDFRNAFSEAGGIYLVRYGFKIKTIKTWGGVPPPVGRPPGPV